MAKSYNLTMQLNLQGPSNLNKVSSKIRKSLSAAAGSLSVKIDKSSISSIDSATKKLAAMASALNKSNTAAINLNASLGKLGKSISAVNSGSQQANQSYQKITQSSAKMTKSLNSASKAAQTLGEKLGVRAFDAAIYSTITRLTNSVTTSLLNAANAAVEFERDMNRVQQIARGSEGAVRGLEKQIRSLSTEFGVSSSEMAKVAVTFKQAGLTSTQLAASLRAVAQASLTPTFTNMQNATEGAIAALRQFKLAANDIEVAFDVMNTLAGNFAVEFDDLVSAIQRGGGAFAAAAGDMQEGTQSLNEFLALFTTVRSTTRESSETIATGIRTISARLQQLSTQRSIEEILGGDLNLNVNGQFVGVYKAIDQISKRVKELGLTTQDARFAQLAEEIGGIRQISRVIPLLTESETRIKALSDAQNAQESSSEAAGMAQKTLAVQLQQTAQAWTNTVAAFANNEGIKTIVSLLLTGTKLAAGFAKAFAPLAPLFAIMAVGKGIKNLRAPTGGGGGGFLRRMFGRGNKRSDVQQRSLIAATQKQTQQSITQTQAVSNQFSATKENTAALDRLTQAVTAASKNNSVQGFARGGVVPGTGNRDTVPAMLTPGEFVIRKDAVKALGTEKLHKMNKYASGGEVLKEKGVGVVSIYDEKREGDVLKEKREVKKDTITKELILEQFKKQPQKQQQISNIYGKSTKSFEYVGEPLSATGLGEQVRGALNEGILQSVDTATANLNNVLSQKGLKPAKIDRTLKDNFLASMNEGVLGNLFEQVLSSVANQGRFTSKENPQAPFDFTNGIGSLNKLFTSIPDDFNLVDAKANLQAGLKSALAKKIGNQILGVEAEALPDTISEGQDRANKYLSGKLNTGAKQLIDTQTIYNTLKNQLKDQNFSKSKAKSALRFDNFPESINQDSYVAPGTDIDDTLKRLLEEKKIKKISYSPSQGSPEIEGYKLLARGGLVQKFMAGGYSKPVSPKQLAFLKSLVEKNGVPEGFEYPPKTSAQASALIDRIKNPPKQGLDLNSLFKEYQQIFGVAHPQLKEAGDFEEEEIKSWTQNIDRTIDKYNKFANVIKEYYEKIIFQDSYSGGFYALGGPNPRMPKRAELDQFVSGGFDRKLLEEFGKRGDLAFGASVNAPRGRGANSSALRTRKTYMRGYAEGGSIEDTVPALLTPGEFVINKKAAAKIGAAKLNKMNRADKVQGFNKGGAVGFVQRFAEGGEAGSLNSQIAVSTAEVKGLAEAQAAAEQEYLGLAARLKKMDDSLVAGIEGNRAYKKAVEIKVQLEKKLLAAEESALTVMEEYQKAEQKRTQLIKKAQIAKQEKNKQRQSSGTQGTVTEGLARLDKLAPSASNAKDVAASMAYIQHAAELSGKSLEEFQKALSSRSKQVYRDSKEQIGSSRQNLKSQILGGLANKDRLTSNKNGEQNNLKGQLASELTNILGDIDSDRLTAVLEETLSQIQAGKSLAEITDTIPELKSAFDESKDSIRASNKATKDLTGEFGKGAESLSLSAEQIAEIEWEDAGGKDKLGGLGKFLDGLKSANLTKGGAFEFSQSKLGKKLTGLQDKLSKPGKLAMGGIGKIPKVGPGLAKGLGGLAKGLGGLKSALGGIPGIASAAASAIAGQFLPSLEQTTSASEAAAVEGTRGALSGAATGAAIGSFIPVIGTAVGAIVGGIVGGIKGAFKGFRAKTLELSLKKLDASTQKLGEKFASYENVKSSEALAQVRVAAKENADALKDVEGQAAMGSRRTYGNYIGSTLTLGLFRFGRPDELNDQALEATLNGMSGMQSSIERLADINAEGMSSRELRSGYDLIKAGSIGSSTFVKTAREDFGLSQRDLARQLASQQLQRSFGTGDLFRENYAKQLKTGELDRIGNNLLKEKAENLQLEQIQRKTNEEINNEIENILSKFTTLNSIVDRMRKEMERTVVSVRQQSYDVAGNREIREDFMQNRNTQLDILTNPRAYSAQEFNTAAEETGAVIDRLGIDAVGQEVSDALKAGRVIDIDLPRILSQADATNVDQVADKLDEALKQAGISDTNRRSIRKDVVDTIERKTEQGGTVSLQNVADEVPALASALKSLKAQQELGVNVQTLWNDAIRASISIANEWTSALEESRKRALQAEKARILGENSIKEALGGRLSLADRNAGFKAELNSLLPDDLKVKGSTINSAEVEAIADRRARTLSAIEAKQSEIDSAAPGSNTDSLVKELALLRREDANLVEALDNVAGSTEAMDNALRQYADQQARDQKRLSFGERLLTADPSELFQMNYDLNALNLALGAGSDQERAAQFATAEGRAAVFRGLDSGAMDFMALDEQAQRAARARATLSMAEADPARRKLLDMKMADGRSWRDVLEQQIDPSKSPEAQAAKAALDAQTTAAVELKKMNDNLAEDIGAKIADPFKKFTEELPRIIADAIAERNQRDIEQQTDSGPPQDTREATPPTGTYRDVASQRDMFTEEAAATAQQITDNINENFHGGVERAKKYGLIDPDEYAAASPEQRQEMLKPYETEYSLLPPERLQELERLLILYANQMKAVQEKELQMARMRKESADIPLGIIDPNLIPTEEIPDVSASSATIESQAWSDSNPLPVRIVEFAGLSKKEEPAPTVGSMAAKNPPALGPGVVLTKAARTNLERKPAPTASSDSSNQGLVGTKILEAINAVPKIANTLGSVYSVIENIFEQTKKLDGLSELLKTIKIPLEITSGSKETIDSFKFAVVSFDESVNKYISRLEQIHIPDEVNIKAQHTVNVNHNGAEMFAAMEDNIKKMVADRVKDELCRHSDGEWCD